MSKEIIRLWFNLIKLSEALIIVHGAFSCDNTMHAE